MTSVAWMLLGAIVGIVGDRLVHNLKRGLTTPNTPAYDRDIPAKRFRVPDKPTKTTGRAGH